MRSRRQQAVSRGTGGSGNAGERERGRTDGGRVAGDAVVGVPGRVRDEPEDVVQRPVHVAAAERHEVPVGLHGRERRVVRVERRVRRAAQALGDAVAEDERVDAVVHRVRCALGELLR